MTGVPHSGREFTIDLTDLTLRGLVFGANDNAGQLTLGLHGWLDNAMTFSELAPRLTSCEFLALDLPGHGHSDHRPPGCRYHLIDYIGDVCAVIASLRQQHAVKRIDLVGHSLGAAVASMVAAVIPDDIGRLVLIEGLGPRTREANQAVAGHRATIQAQRARKHRPVRTIADMDTAAKARHLAGALSEHGARALVERNLKAVPGGWQWRSDPRLRDVTALYLSEATVRAHLNEITAPTLVIRAMDTDDADQHWILDRLQCVPNLQLSELPGAHHLHLDDPQPVADVINRFIQSTPQR